jgi:hypothetical protein
MLWVKNGDERVGFVLGQVNVPHNPDMGSGRRVRRLPISRPCPSSGFNC